MNIKKIMGWDQPPKASKGEIAKELFPNSKHPVRSLTRVLNGDQDLKLYQVKKLAEIAGCTVDEILNS